MKHQVIVSNNPSTKIKNHVKMLVKFVTFSIEIIYDDEMTKKCC